MTTKLRPCQPPPPPPSHPGWEYCSVVLNGDFEGSASKPKKVHSYWKCSNNLFDFVFLVGFLVRELVWRSMWSTFWISNISDRKQKMNSSKGASLQENRGFSVCVSKHRFYHEIWASGELNHIRLVARVSAVNICLFYKHILLLNFKENDKQIRQTLVEVYPRPRWS